MNYEEQKLEVRLHAASMSNGQTVYINCPACAGHKKLSITRTPEGVLWNCFKAACNVRGSTVEKASLTSAPAERRELKPYTRPIVPITPLDIEYFRERFGIITEYEDIFLSGDDRYIFPIVNYYGHTAGYILREPVWSGVESPRKGTGKGPKAVTYMHADGPTQSWYRSNFGRNSVKQRLILVEDMLSAMKVAQQTEHTAVALLGTELDARKVRELSMYRPDEVIIALDEDATDKAFKLARKWGLAFPKVRVAILEQDIKDTDNDDVLEVLGL